MYVNSEFYRFVLIWLVDNKKHKLSTFNLQKYIIA